MKKLIILCGCAILATAPALVLKECARGDIHQSESAPSAVCPLGQSC